MKNLLITTSLYGVLGGVLSYAGVSFSENPLTFLSIVSIVVAIDLNSFNHGMRSDESLS